ncbi:MAG TPA: SAM-dependent methyltransferase [Terriglobia bacterium]|nr:SAM-dependent methyltransferase [Terriglobia bacterium]
MNSLVPSPVNRPSTLSWLKPSEALRAIYASIKTAGYLLKLGPQQVCWDVESLELAHGHWRSKVEQMPMDQSGQPLPWYTYAAIQYLNQIDLRDRDVFEFGSGNGSFFWAERTRTLVSVESDRQWYELINSRKRANQDLLLVENLELYPDSIRRHDRQYDVIVIDGKRRKLCAESALPCLKDDGIIVLDNSDWYPKAAALLRNSGLIQIDFHGFGPINNYTSTTSLFLRPGVRIKPRYERLPVPGIGAIVQTGDE